MRIKNTGLCPKTGKTFGELMDHFVLGGDETCLLASDGDVRIIGDAEKKKHEVNNGNSRTSITMYRIGSAAGATGPTAFLPPGKRRREGYDSAFLQRHGAPVGSSIVMTPTGYMTEDAWLEMAEETAAGIRAMPVICDNPNWWVIKIIDGFGPHTSSVEAMKIYAKHKILLVKEEGDTSHVCQAYDQKVAKDDKGTMRGCLAFLRKTTDLLRSNVDGWDLVHVGLAAVRELEPESWVSSFKRVNLNPHERVAFPAWCKRIGCFLEGGQLFKTEDELDIYQLLPVFWQVHSMINMRYKMFLVLLNNCCQHAHSKHATLVVCAVNSLAGHVAGGEEERSLRVCRAREGVDA